MVGFYARCLVHYFAHLLTRYTQNIKQHDHLEDPGIDGGTLCLGVWVLKLVSGRILK
jgi:hypothetical protein